MAIVAAPRSLAPLNLESEPRGSGDHVLSGALPAAAASRPAADPGGDPENSGLSEVWSPAGGEAQLIG